MFGLPLETTLLVFGFPLLWIVYTAIFLLVTRNWEHDTPEEDGR
jgi:hypothetical protein